MSDTAAHPGTGAPPFTRLLVPVDGAELMPRAVQASIDLARQLGVSIVGFIAEAPVPLPAGATASVEQLRSEERAQRVLRGFEERARAAGIAFEGHYHHATDIAGAIVQAASEHGCDMIVMVTHGRGTVGRLLFGSHTQQVLGRSTIPVLVMH
jgi:nucleotide-binding universal stress UspA family protein